MNHSITFPGRGLFVKPIELTIKMHIHHTDHSFVIQIKGEPIYNLHQPSSSKLNLSAMKLFHRFRKILMRLLFSLPNNNSSKQKNCDKFDPPKTSCSSYYSSQSHYSEAIADCIEFLNKSSQEGVFDGTKAHVLV
ncbi:uncharacterized protein LOC126656707 [Mercurialis annua]|uniref:uncharacterized protein LOC126656707 n=1 Tax=Mercurialis annua TaxID=3986 RepID=UPI0024AEC23C|nr:uncharacterized protein LOC126656707 [Mercurialis annua]